MSNTEHPQTYTQRRKLKRLQKLLRTDQQHCQRYGSVRCQNCHSKLAERGWDRSELTNFRSVHVRIVHASNLSRPPIDWHRSAAIPFAGYQLRH